MTDNTDPEPDQTTILVVDDSADNLSLLQSLLQVRYTVKVANNGESGLTLASAEHPPQLILLGIQMPGMDGYEVCRRLKANPATRDIPVIFLTDPSELQDEQLGFALGAVDFINTPVRAPLVLARVHTQLTLKATVDLLRNKQDLVESEVIKRTHAGMVIRDVIILAMASMSETRDADTANHIRRTQHYVKVLARHLASHPRFSAFLTLRNIEMLYKTTPLHDIGKVAIPDRILLKPGKLLVDEIEIMKTHTTLGRDAIEHAEKALGTDVPFLTMAMEIAYSHHEKWDGSGYPEGLKGDQIPIAARLMAVADVYDALISRRVYKESMPHEQAVAIIQQTRGRHFDPDVVDAFVVMQDKFHAIAMLFADSDADLKKKTDYLEIAKV